MVRRSRGLLFYLLLEHAVAMDWVKTRSLGNLARVFGTEVSIGAVEVSGLK